MVYRVARRDGSHHTPDPVILSWSGKWSTWQEEALTAIFMVKGQEQR
jgi:hypothetical protein